MYIFICKRIKKHQAILILSYFKNKNYESQIYYIQNENN